MTRWIIELEGDKFDLHELLALNCLPDVSISEEQGKYYLRSDDFNLCEAAKDVLKSGGETVDIINGIAQIRIKNWRKVSVHGVSREEDNGTRTQFLFPKSCLQRSRVSGNLSLKKSDGTINMTREPSFFESAFATAKRDANVEKALRIHGSRAHNWVNLYIVYEIVEADVGGRHVIVGNGWSSKAQINDFKHTANSIAAAGDDARHGKEKTAPPKNTMLLSEAESLIKTLLQHWISFKTKSYSPLE